MGLGVFYVRYSVAIWDRRVYNQCVGGMVPSELMHGRESEWQDRTVVRQVSAQDKPGTCPVTGGGVMVMV